MANDFDEFEKRILQMASEFKGGKYAKPYLKREAKKLIKIQVEKAIELTEVNTGKFISSFRIGKPYVYGGSFAIRGYNNSPHAHLIDQGHIIVDKNGVEHGFKRGVHYVEKAKNQFEAQFYEDTQKFIDNMLNKYGLS